MIRIGRDEKVYRSGERGGAGFTLIEVLIASIILALGALSLLTLFAGAAGQQRIAAETTSAMLASRSAEAIIGPRFANLGGPLLAERNNGEWYPVPVDTGRGPNGVLSIDPGRDGELYFEVSNPFEFILYDFGRASVNTAGGDGRFNYRPRDAALPGGTDSIFRQNAGRNTTIYNFPHRRIVPESISAVYVVTDDAGNVPRDQIRGESDPPLSYRRVDETQLPLAGGTIGGAPTWPEGFRPDPDDSLVLFTRSGQLENSENDYILLDLQVGDDVAIADDRLASVVGFGIAPVYNDTNRIIRRIYVPRYSYRVDEVISAEDRLTRKDDGSPEAAYSLLYRNSPDKGTQIAIFTYFIRTGRANGPTEYAPDERVNGDRTLPAESPLQRVELTLRYDQDLEQYYVVSVDRDLRWPVAEGQLLLFEEGPDDLDGADLEVRVVGQRVVGSELRGYLDRVPRSNGRAMLEARAGSERLFAFGIQETIRNRSDADSPGLTWELSPRRVEFVQVE